MSDWWSAAPLASDAGGGGSAPTRFTVTPRDRELAIRTVLGEAADEPDEGQRAVAAVIQNRVKAGRYGGEDIPRVVTAKNQFEPWNTQDGRSRMYSYAPDSEAYKRAAANVDAIFNGVDPDPTNGATHFVAPQAQAALGRQMPSWAQGEGQPIGRHTFYAPDGPRNGVQNRPQNAPETGGNDWWQNAPIVSTEQPSPTSGGQFMAPLPDGGNARVAREGVSEPAPRQIGVAEAAGRGAARGVTANFYDELRGLMEAGGLNPNDPASLGALMQGAYKYWTGDPNAAKTYDAATARERETDKRAQAEQPVASIGGELAGAVALPLGAAAQGAGLGARLGRSAMVGAGYGAASGAGEGSGIGDRAANAIRGAGIGTVAGAAAVPAAAALSGAVNAGAAVARPVTAMIKGAINPEGEAGRRVVGAITRDMQQGSAGLTPAEFAAQRSAGTPVANLDLGGETTRALARSAANTSTEGRAALQSLADARFEGQSDRATQFLRGIVGNADNQATRDALKVQAAAANKPAYAKAYNSPQAASMWDEGFEQLMQAPIVQEAAKAATRTGANRAAVEGFTPVRNPFNFEGDRFTLAGEGKPSLQFWDSVKRNLDDKISSLQRAGENSAARDATQLRSALVSHLDDLVPAYKNARAGAARFFGAEDALTAGENFVKSSMTAADGARALAKMSGPERELFKQGFAARIIDDITNTRDRVNVLNKIGQSPQARAKLQAALGPEGYARVESYLTTETVLDKFRGALGNSTTARQLVELGLAGGAGGAITGDYSPKTMLTSALVYGVGRKAGQRIDERVARRVAEMLSSNDPSVLAKGVRMVANNQSLKLAFRNLSERLALMGGQQSRPAIAGQ